MSERRHLPPEAIASRRAPGAFAPEPKAAEAEPSLLARTGSYIRRTVPRILSRTSLTNQIIFMNVIALVAIMIGVLYLKQFRDGLIELRKQELTRLGDVIAVTVAEAAGDEANVGFDRIIANEVLRRLASRAKLRAQIYDRGGRLMGDTRALIMHNMPVEQEPLRPPVQEFSLMELIDDLSDRFKRLHHAPMETYRETPPIGISQDAEVYDALAGGIGSAQRLNSQKQMILSVAVPVTRVKLVLGALVLSTEGGVIDQIIYEDRMATVRLFVVAFIVIVGLSLMLAHIIAHPIIQLAHAADRGRTRERGRVNVDPSVIPDLTNRRDEIGDLSNSMRQMTGAFHDQVKSSETFAADVAHEIKNPLTSLRSAVESLEITQHRPDLQKRLLDVIQKDVSRMDRLVTDISNASRLDGEMLREELRPFDLNDLLETVVANAQFRAEKRGVDVLLFLPPDERPIVNGMETRLAQVFNNLLDNALSFSMPGDTIKVTTRPQSSDTGDSVRIEVVDEGPGIPEENLESIFGRFYSQRPDTEDFGNHSGLGLSICRTIVKAHNGKIWAENRTDRSGARFNVLLAL